MTFRIRAKSYLWTWFKYNLLVTPVIAAIYIPYNVLWIQYSPLQLFKWLSSMAGVGAVANFLIQPWISYCHRKKWLQ